MTKPTVPYCCKTTIHTSALSIVKFDSNDYLHPNSEYNTTYSKIFYVSFVLRFMAA